MFVIKVSLKNETRRLVFDGSRFPSYSDVQAKIRDVFRLPTTALTFWVDVLLFPSDAEEARIMLKRHVCDSFEYEQAQKPFLHTHLPSPSLRFTVLLSSDSKLASVHSYHRAVTLLNSSLDVEIHIAQLEDDVAKKATLLTALDNKYHTCEQAKDKLGMNFWGDRAVEKRKEVSQLHAKIAACRLERNGLEEELEGPILGTTLRSFAAQEQRNEAERARAAQDELAAWLIGHTSTDQANAFPPLEDVLRSGPFRQAPADPRHRRHQMRFGPYGHFPPTGPPAIRNFIDRVNETVNNTNALVPAQEIKTMLDTFLVNLTNQLSGTFDGARVAEASADTSTEQRVPGAFVNAETQTSPAPPTPRASSRPSEKLGKGGFRHKHISCDGCLTGIRGMRYKCEQCHDYDLCGSCLPLLHTGELHPIAHTFKAMLHPRLEERVKMTAHESDRHPATCDLCSQSVIGVRWKCLNCPDWDCCSSCAATIEDTHPGHSFVKLYRASDYVGNALVNAKEEVRHSHVICDGCEKTIYGARFKCMHPACPDYDLCEKCEASPFPVHPDTHPMLKTKIPLRVDHTSTIDHAAEVMTSRGFGGHRRGPCSTAPDNTQGKKWRWHNDHRLFQAEPAGPALPGGFAVEQVEEMPSALSAPLVPDSEPFDTPTGPETQPTQHIEDVSEVVVPAPAQQPVKEVIEAKDVAEIKNVAEVKDEPAERPKAPVSPLDIFSWARHVTIPAGCILPAGAEFTKTWKVKHFASGDEYDFDEVRLVHQSGGKMLGDGVNPDIRFKRTEIIENAEVEISMYGLRVPNTPGEEIIEHWRFEDKNGIKYGQPLRLRMTVEATKSAASSLASSTVIMPVSTDSSLHLPPPPRPEFPPATPAYAHIPVNPSPMSRADAADSEEIDDAVSVHSCTSSYIDVEDFTTTTSGSVSHADERQIRDEFDFVDEDEDDLTADEL